MIKPDAMEQHRGSSQGHVHIYLCTDVDIMKIPFLVFILTESILEEIHGRGFSVTQLKETVLSRQMAEEFYKEHREKPFFSQLVEFMCRLVYPKIQPQDQD